MNSLKNMGITHSPENWVSLYHTYFNKVFLSWESIIGKVYTEECAWTKGGNSCISTFILYMINHAWTQNPLVEINPFTHLTVTFNKDKSCVSDRNLARVVQMSEIQWILPSVELRQGRNGPMAYQE